MLERVTLKQTRFRTPGLQRDQRGIAIGDRGVVLFTSLDRLVAFFRAYTKAESIDELASSLEIKRLTTSLQTREVMLSFAASSSYRMDQVAGIARLTGGMVFTGGDRHFVRYRDAASPLGYDLVDLDSSAADVLLYEGSFKQAYSIDRPISLLSLILRLTPRRVAVNALEALDRAYFVAEVGLGPAVVRYFYRWQVDAQAALVEWPSESAFDDTPRRLYVFDVNRPPARIVSLLASVPGVRVFKPEGGSLGVEHGFAHPMELRSCETIFAGQGLHLFEGTGETLIANPMPQFSPVAALVVNDIEVEAAGTPAGSGAGASPPMLRVPLRLAASQGAWKNVIATVIPLEQGPWLARLLYAIPSRLLSGLKIAQADNAIYLLSPNGIEGLPLGTFFCETAPRIYIPAGSTILPSIAPDLLTELVPDAQSGHVFFQWGDAPPVVVPRGGFAEVGRETIYSLASMSANLSEPADRIQELPLLQYDEARRFPTWGLPGQDLSEGGDS